MGRRTLSTNLDQMVEDYGALKEREGVLKKKIKPLNDGIKKQLLKQGEDKYTSDNWTVKISEKKNEDFNEDKAIEILRKELPVDDFKEVVRTKEYIDDDALESLVYNGDFDISLLDSCTIEKPPTIRLTVSKKKD